MEDDNEGKVSYINWDVKKIFDKCKNFEMFGKNIKYNVVKFSYQRRYPDIEDLSNHNGFIILYTTEDNKLYYITSRNSDAKTIVRKLLGYTGKEEIVESNHNIKNDLILWMIYKVYTKNNLIGVDDDKVKLSIDGIKAFKGDSPDLATTVSADGESVMNIISTMSFLLERGKINSIVIDISYANHESIEIILNVSNYPSIKIESYAGEYNNADCILQREWLLYILLFVEILTNITQTYMDELELGLWNENQYKEFLKEVAEDLSKEVDLKLKDLEADETSLSF